MLDVNMLRVVNVFVAFAFKQMSNALMCEKRRGDILCRDIGQINLFII